MRAGLTTTAICAVDLQATDGNWQFNWKLKHEEGVTGWKGSKARSLGAGFKLFYYGVDGKRNGVGVVLKEKFVRNVLKVKRGSVRVMSLKIEVEGVMFNVVSGYVPQVRCELEEEKFSIEVDEVMQSIPRDERELTGAAFNGYVGEGNRSDDGHVWYSG